MRFLSILNIFLALNFDSSLGSSIFVLIGGTGELSAKYLWDAVFRQIYLKPDRSMQIFTSGRSDDKEGKQKLTKILKNLHCKSDENVENCQDNMTNFTNDINYVKLENDPDYGKFCRDLLTSDKNENAENITEILWYLATPPTYYPMILMSIHTRCRLVEGLKIKIALEKPFWKDSEEYAILSRILRGRFLSNELYFVDHYLVKETSLILNEFKSLNKNWFKIRQLDKLELVLLEREYVKDTRLRYYDSYGVVRDVMQSHFNEILLKLLNDGQDILALGQNSGQPIDDDDDEDDERANIRDLLNRFRPFARSSWLLGQHANYRLLTKSKSKTPTFASLQLKFDVSPDSGDTIERNILLVSGKYMNSKRSYARMTFKNGDLKNSDPLNEVIFLFSSPAIFIKPSSNDTIIEEPLGWTTESNSQICQKWLSRLFTDSTCDQLITLRPRLTDTDKLRLTQPPKNPYEIIIDQFIKENGQKSATFTKMSIVEESWKILWSHILKEIDQKEPTIYEKPDELLGKIFTNERISPKIEL